LGSAGRARLCELYPGIYLTNEEKARKNSVRVVEKFPDISVVAVQYTFTYKQCTECRERNTCTNRKKNKIGKCGPCPVFASYTLAFAFQLKEKHGVPTVRVVEKCPDIPVTAVQYTFTHKQYTVKHNDTEYTERNIHNKYE
jgi:hypothetical protein